MTNNDNPILDAVTKLLSHPVWDENTHVSAEVYEAELLQNPYVGRYKEEEDGRCTCTLFPNGDHSVDNLLGRLVFAPRKNGTIRMILTACPMDHPLRTEFPFEEIVQPLEKRFGGPVTHLREKILLDAEYSSVSHLYSTPAGRVHVAVELDTERMPMPVTLIVGLAPNLDEQKPSWR